MQEYQQTKTFNDYLAGIRRRIGLVVITFLLILIVSVVIAFGLPAIYQSGAMIEIQRQEVPEDLVRSTVTSYAEQRIAQIKQRALRTDNLWRTIIKHDLYKEERENYPREVVIDEMRGDISQNMVSTPVIDPISGRPTSANIAFTVSYRSKSPELAQKVANELMTLYLHENAENRKEKATETTVFLEDESRKLQAKLSLIGEGLANFKEKNGNSLPELLNMNLSLMNRVESQIDEVDVQNRSLKERIIFLEAQLVQLSPYNNMISSGEIVQSPEDRLKFLKNKLLRVKAYYGEEHPDVVRMEKEISALENEIGWVDESEKLVKQLEANKSKLAELKGRYSESYPDIKKLKRENEKINDSLLDIQEKRKSKSSVNNNLASPDNPAYIQIKAQLEAAKVESESLSAKRLKLLQKHAEYENRITATPLVEKEYQELLREYEEMTLKQKDIKARLMEATLAQSLEYESKGEQFIPIEYPQTPEKPISPNRLMILIMGLIISIGGSLGLVLLLDHLDTRIWTSAGVKLITGVTPLVVIPYSETKSDKRKRAIKVIVITAIFFIVIIAGLIAIHFGFKPLDVLWYVLQRKIKLMFI